MYSPGYQRPLTLSPSGLKLAATCWRAYVERYVYGAKDTETKLHLLRGLLIHACLEQHVKGGSIYHPHIDARLQAEIDTYAAQQVHYYQTRARNPLTLFDAQVKVVQDIEALKTHVSQIAITALRYLPDVRAVGLSAFAERASACDVRKYHTPEPLAGLDGAGRLPPAWRISERSSRDLIVYYNGGVMCLDYKSTAGAMVDANGERSDTGKHDPWFYVPAPEALALDVQYLVYGLETLDEAYGRVAEDTTFFGRWIYMSTKGKPDSTCVDAATPGDVLLERLQLWFKLGDRCAQALDDANKGLLPDINALELPSEIHGADSPCQKYGGCLNHVSRGGRCKPPEPTIQQMFAHVPLIGGPKADAKRYLPLAPETLTTTTTTTTTTTPGLGLGPEAMTQETLPNPSNGAVLTPAQTQAMLADRITQASAAGSGPFRTPEMPTSLVGLPVPGVTPPTGMVNSYPVWGLPGVLAKYANGNAVTDAAGNYLDTNGARVVDSGPSAYAVPPPVNPAPQTYAAPEVVQAIPLTPPTVTYPALQAQAIMAPAPQAPVPHVQTSPIPAVAQASAYTPPPAVAAPVAAPKSKGKPRRGKDETEDMYQMRIAAWQGVNLTPVAAPAPAQVPALAPVIPDLVPVSVTAPTEPAPALETFAETVTRGLVAGVLASAENGGPTRPFGTVAILLDNLKAAQDALVAAGYGWLL